MAETLVLVVDRDDDFGVKARVDTPVIGIEAALNAAMLLGTADPEDSDVNALFSAIHIYKELKDDKKDVEIALVCGDAVVGHKSDLAVVEEINEVLDKVQPKNAILVGDGAEDEYVYPIVSSRVPIDSVKKVYVKQTPGVEGTVYILSKTISDPYKRKRFLAPIGLIICAIAMIFIIVDISGYSATQSRDYILSLSVPLVVLLIGLLLLMYAYNTISIASDIMADWNERLHRSNITILFTTLAIGVFALGLFIAVYSIKDIWDNNLAFVSMTFIQNIIWPVCFMFMISSVGKLVEDYVYESSNTDWGQITWIIMLFGIAFIVQAITDIVLMYLGYSFTQYSTIGAEALVGVVLMVAASFAHGAIKKYGDKECVTDEA